MKCGTGMRARSEDGRRLVANAEEWLSTIKTDSDGISPAGITAMPAPTMRGTWLLRRKPLRRVTLSKRKIATSTLSITSGRCVRVRTAEESDNHAERLALLFVWVARWRLLAPALRRHIDEGVMRSRFFSQARRAERRSVASSASARG